MADIVPQSTHQVHQALQNSKVEGVYK